MDTSATLAQYPEIQRLLDLLTAGWTFLPHVEDGRLTVIVGAKAWGDTGYADALQTRTPTDAAAVRTNPDGRVVWQCEGTLNDVVDDLISLPLPEAPGAPRLVKATTSWLWTPRGGR